MAAEQTPLDERKYRNYVIAGAIGGFLLPFAGLVGALLFAQRGDERAAERSPLASFVGILAYVLIFGAPVSAPERA